MIQMKRNVTDLVGTPVHYSTPELIFPGGKFELEKRPFPLILAANYGLLSLFLLANVGFSVESLCWSAVFLSLGTGILTRFRGRLLALMTFSVPVLLVILSRGMGPMNLTVLWIVSLISISAAYSSFHVVSGFMKWLKSRREASI